MTKKQRGDTIVGALLAMAVIGMVLGSSFGIANRSLNIARSAHERTKALKIAESQLELLKVLHKDGFTIPNDDFCVLSDNFTSITDSGTKEPCNDKNSSSGDNGLYTMVISHLATTGSYKINVSWDRIGASASAPRDEVNLYYRLGAL